MYDNVTVSVIIPVYEVERYIDRAMKSVLSQTFRDFEIILVDDGSSKSLADTCDAYAKKDVRIHVIHKENGGVGDARNAGLDIARGKYVYFMDSDDLAEPNLLADNITIAEENDCDIVVFGFISILCDKNDNCIKKTHVLPKLDGAFSGKEFRADFINHISSAPHAVWNRLYRRDFIGSLRFYKDCIVEDAIFNIELYKKGFDRIYYNPNAYYIYYGRFNSLMNRYNPSRFEYETSIADSLLRLAKLWQPDSDCEKYFARRYVGILLNEYSNMTMYGCRMSDAEIVLTIKKLAEDSRIKHSMSVLSYRDFPYLTSRISFILTRCGHYKAALNFRRLYIPISLPVKKIFSAFGKKTEEHDV